ncbi:hypothetical protein PSN13_06489 [Micromonospora saelicesensis]|uniref:Uncharacterized protein n=1 Tax=Micromonospora saelicesensis TaxID=285676 RepID=A0A328NIJ0_9ACTN|nr:hypothetical protein [Micromonospora saelicesensis]RAO26461.1 hypothetical protein PSN13_06489 [Micromonospora saelicesensis]
MPGSTSIYGFRYLEPEDPPDIAGGLQNLGQDVEDELALRAPSVNTAALSSLYTLTDTVSNLPGCVINVTTPRAGAVALITWTADCVLTTAGSASLTAVTNVSIDNVDQPYPQPVWGPGNQAVQANTRGTVSAAMLATLGAGAHAFRLRGAASSSTGQIKLNALLTQLSVLILP